MHRAIVALLIAFFLAAESATIFVDDDGFRPRAIGALVSDGLANSANADNDRRKFTGPGTALAITYPDSLAGELHAQRYHGSQRFYLGKSPLYQLNANWRI